MNTSWLTWRSKKCRGSRLRRHPTRAKLRLEQFEPRLVPSFTISTYATGVRPSAVAAADFQGIGDGVVDFATSNIGDNTVSVFLNHHDGTGTFATAVSYPAGSGPVDIAAAPLTNSAVPDLVVSDYLSNSVMVLLHDPAHLGHFLPGVTYAVNGSPRDVRLADLNGDGFDDIITANYTT
jgi:hypothetical protein